MTSKDKVLAVYPNAFAVRSNGWLWSVYPDNASGCLNSAEDSSETEEAAWQNAAESLLSAPEPICHYHNGPFQKECPLGGKCERIEDWGKTVVEPVTPVEAKEKESSFLPPLGDRSLHFEDKDVVSAMVGSDYLIGKVKERLMFMTSGEKWSLYRAIVKLSNPVAEPKPTPSAPAKREAHLENILREAMPYLQCDSGCDCDGDRLWQKIRSELKPQSDSSPVSAELAWLDARWKSALVEGLEEYSNALIVAIAALRYSKKVAGLKEVPARREASDGGS